jgi:hypothetical protein
MDPHLFWCPGSGSELGTDPDPENGNRPKFTNKYGFLLFKKTIVSSCICFLTYYLLPTLFFT